MLDMAKHVGDGQIDEAMRILASRNAILDDIDMLPPHRVTIRTGLPKVTFRRINDGLRPPRRSLAEVLGG